MHSPCKKTDLKQVCYRLFPIQISKAAELARLRGKHAADVVRDALDDHFERVDRCLKK
jgi:hypothetical protein